MTYGSTPTRDTPGHVESATGQIRVEGAADDVLGNGPYVCSVLALDNVRIALLL